jgi:quinoprotein glucose dehydrogenase
MRGGWWLIALPALVQAQQSVVAPVPPRAVPEAVEAGAPPAAAPADGDWSAYGRSNAALRYSPLQTLDRDNVAALTLAWRYSLKDMPRDLKARWAPHTTPLKVDDTLYLCSGRGSVIALEAATGDQRWRHDSDLQADQFAGPATCRGVSFHESLGANRDGLCRERILAGTADGRVRALDAASGRPCTDFGEQGVVTLPGDFSGPVSPPTLVRGVAVTRAGDRVVGLSAATGRLLWQWPPAEARGQFAAEAVFSADEALGLVYVPLARPAMLVAVDVTSGEAAWRFRGVHDDVWGYGLSAQATLLPWLTPEGEVPALVLPTRQGELFVLDRATGEPLVPVTQQQTPTAYAPDGVLPASQPVSEGLPGPRARLLREEDIGGVSPVDQLWCRIQFRRLAYQGRFTPPGPAPWLQYPGDMGGIDWGGVSFDPERALLVFNYNQVPMVGEIRDGVPYRTPWGEVDRLCLRPPHGGIMAVSTRAPAVRWDRPLGRAGLPLPFGLSLPLPGDTGTPNQGGVLLTASGLAFIAATTDNLIRALDTETGEELWRARLPAGGQATPISYAVDGRQYIALLAGGDYRLETPLGGELLVFSLPE